MKLNTRRREVNIHGKAKERWGEESEDKVRWGKVTQSKIW